jgi:hypothetical protein
MMTRKANGNGKRGGGGKNAFDRTRLFTHEQKVAFVRGLEEALNLRVEGARPVWDCWHDHGGRLTLLAAIRRTNEEVRDILADERQGSGRRTGLGYLAQE